MGGWFYMVLFLAEEGPQKTQEPSGPSPGKDSLYYRFMSEQERGILQD